MKKIFIEKKQINNEKIILNKEQLNHIKALRLFNVIACDEEFDYECDVLDGSLIINNKSISTGELGYNLTLYICFPKGDKIKKVVETACLLGATKIVPVISEFVQVSKSIAEKKCEKLSKIAYEASGVAGRGKTPIIANPISFKEIFEGEDRIILAYENEKINSITGEMVGNDNLGIVVGSEGGFSQKEIEYAISKKADIITLGDLILKVELAVASVLSIIIHEKKGRKNERQA